jgi:hypothetical protein
MSKLRAAALLTAVIGMFIATIGVTNAGEVEHEVITGSIDATLESEVWWEGADDLNDIWLDTEADSYCEQYAATGSVIFALFSAYEEAEDIYGGESEEILPFVVSVQGITPLFDELDSIANRCLNEE